MTSRASVLIPNTGAVDVVMDPVDPETLCAGLSQRVRRKWSVWNTTDGAPASDKDRYVRERPT